MTGFYMNLSTELKWVNSFQANVASVFFLEISENLLNKLRME